MYYIHTQLCSTSLLLKVQLTHVSSICLLYPGCYQLKHDKRNEWPLCSEDGRTQHKERKTMYSYIPCIMFHLSPMLMLRLQCSMAPWNHANLRNKSNASWVLRMKMGHGSIFSTNIGPSIPWCPMRWGAYNIMIMATIFIWGRRWRYTRQMTPCPYHHNRVDWTESNGVS